MLGRLGGRFGFRGRWLIITGCAWLIFGFGTLLSPLAPRQWVIHEQLPIWVNAAGWWVTGAVAIAQGLRGPNRDDHIGHVALYLMPAMRVLSYGLAFALYAGCQASRFLGYDCPSIGFSGGWYSALVWAIVSMMLWSAADWPNPALPMPRPPATSDGDENE